MTNLVGLAVAAALLAPGFTNTWDYVEKDLTIATVPTAGISCRRTSPSSSRKRCGRGCFGNLAFGTGAQEIRSGLSQRNKELLIF